MPRLRDFPLREDGLKHQKNDFTWATGHFEAIQCPRVVVSAQDGERAPGAKAGPDPGSRPMRRNVENALESENLQKYMKKMFGIYEIL